MKWIVILLVLSGCGELYPGLSMGPCGPHDKGKHNQFDFMGIVECVPDGSVGGTRAALD